MSGTPSGHWLRIAATVASSRSDVVPIETLMARVSVAGFDALLVAWITKYRYRVVRPQVYLSRVLHRAWQPYLPTPPFPEYPSGHSTLSAACAAVLTTALCRVPFQSDTRGPGMGEPVLRRSFPDVEAAAREASESRLYAGIHYQPSLAAGLSLGQAVAAGSSVLAQG